jgi:hypothetical protein
MRRAASENLKILDTEMTDNSEDNGGLPCGVKDRVETVLNTPVVVSKIN